MNKEEGKICKFCGKCCCSYWIFTDIPEEVERFKTLNTDKIEVIQIKERLWKVMFHFPCKHLDVDFSTDKYVKLSYRCRIYDKPRPKYCSEYPRNFLEKDIEKEVLENEVNFCPLLAKLRIIKI